MAASRTPEDRVCAQPKKQRRRSYWFSLKNLSPWEEQRRQKFHRETLSASGHCGYRRYQKACRRVADLRYRLDRVERMEMELRYERMTGICEREGRPVPKDIVDLKVLASRAFVEDAEGSRKLCNFYLDKYALENLIDKGYEECARIYREDVSYKPEQPKPFTGYPRRGR